MKEKLKKVALVVAGLAVLALVSIPLSQAFFPHAQWIFDSPAGDILSIDIFDGNTGRSVEVTDRAQIERIVGAMNTVKVKWNGLSIGRMGYGYRLSILTTGGYPISHGPLSAGTYDVIFNDADTVRWDFSFYKVTEGDPGLDYIESLLDAQN